MASIPRGAVDLTFPVLSDCGTASSYMAFQGLYFNQPELLYPVATGWVVESQWMFGLFFTVLGREGWNYDVRVYECQGSSGDLLLSGRLGTSLCILSQHRI